MGLYKCPDVKDFGLYNLIKHLGKLGAVLYDRARGIDNREVETRRIRKSLSVERTFSQDIVSYTGCHSAIESLYNELVLRTNKKNYHEIMCKQVVKIKFNDFVTTTIERKSSHISIDLYKTLLHTAMQRKSNQPIRLIGLGIVLATKKQQGPVQLSFW